MGGKPSAILIVLSKYFQKGSAFSDLLSGLPDLLSGLPDLLSKGL
jgi:hypothetical protein